jgi:hypothetical protein
VGLIQFESLCGSSKLAFVSSPRRHSRDAAAFRPERGGRQQHPEMPVAESEQARARSDHEFESSGRDCWRARTISAIKLGERLSSG